MAFVRRCAGHRHPLFELGLLRVRGFGLANAASFTFSVAFSIMLLSNVLWCQQLWHYSALRTGLAMVPGPALVPVVTVLSSRAVHRFGPGPLAAAGSAFFAAAMLWRVGLVSVRPNYLRDLLPSMLLGGTGVGLALGTLIAAGVTALPAHRSATGSAMVNVGRQVAAAVGVAILVSLLGSRLAGVDVVGFRQAWLVAAALAGLAGVLALALPRPVASQPVADVARRPGPSCRRRGRAGHRIRSVMTEFALFETAIGTCGIAWTELGISNVLLPGRSPEQTRGMLAGRYGADGRGRTTGRGGRARSRPSSG